MASGKTKPSLLARRLSRGTYNMPSSVKTA